MEKIKLIQGDSAEILKQYPDNYFDSIVTDPPYGIEFLGKDWDKNTGAIEVWKECLRVLKPGGHILAFSAARTYHRLATNLEDVGFEIRDQLMWIYGSGFPKGQDMGKLIEKRGNDGEEYKGWKTGLKPAHEPIVMARKPFKGSTVDNVVEYGTGAINIDDTRIQYISDHDKKHQHDIARGQDNATNGVFFGGRGKTKAFNHTPEGRYPSNVIMSEEDKEYSKYFYCPKVSRKERNIGCDMHEPITGKDIGPWSEKGERLAVKLDKMTTKHNNHPTVKPVALMKYLVTLVTPKGGKVLDPFNGSGSTGMAVKEFGGEYTGIDLNPDYIEISKKRIDAW